MEKTILNLLNKYHGNWDDVYNAVSHKEDTEHNILNFDLPNDLDRRFIASKDYPDKFKDIFSPPFFIFSKGNIKLLDNYVLGLSTSLTDEDYDILILEYKLFNKYTLCFKVNDIKQDQISTLISKGYNIILISEGGFNNLDLNQYLETNQILLISEFWNTNAFKACSTQTLERIVFAVADDVYINSSNLSVIDKILYNYDQKHKPIYVSKNNEQIFINLKNDNIKFSYIKNVNDIIQPKFK